MHSVQAAVPRLPSHLLPAAAAKTFLLLPSVRSRRQQLGALVASNARTKILNSMKMLKLKILKAETNTTELHSLECKVCHPEHMPHSTLSAFVRSHKSAERAHCSILSKSISRPTEPIVPICRPSLMHASRAATCPLASADTLDAAADAHSRKVKLTH